MEKPVKYLLILLLGLAVIIGASGFSFIVHHCFTGDHTEITLKSGHSDDCCHHPDHKQVNEPEKCCHGEGQNNETGPYTELNHKCCEEGLLSMALLPVIVKNSASDIFLNISEVTISETFVIQGISEISEHEGIHYPPPPKPLGRHILLVNQIFLL
jgi:hypothetical protein